MRQWLAILAILVPASLVAAGEALVQTPTWQPQVEAEEDVYSFTGANNGAGPLWCFGSTCLVRVGQDVFASGLDTLADAKPLNNCRWTLYRRGSDGWRQVQLDAVGRTREPCPLVTLPGGRVLLSANPTLVADRQTYSGPARPEILQFSAEKPQDAAEKLAPVWEGQPEFTEHSYRSFAADGASGALILLQNIGYTHAEWAFRDGAGKWAACGKLKWPWGAEYDTPQPIRVCYPNVAVRGRAVYFCGVSDIVEPYQKWREYKERLTGQKWDYDFRRLFLTWTDDISTGKFQPWVEIASRDRTCGWIMPCDLWVAPDGDVHVLWNERALDERLRKEFFPNEKQVQALQYAVVRAGRVLQQRSLVRAEEGGAQEVAGRGRFQVTPDGRLFVIFYVSGRNAQGQGVSENRLVELKSDGSSGEAVRVPLKQPFSDFFTATVRGGSAPSTTLDLFGHRAGSGGTLSYARIKL